MPDFLEHGIDTICKIWHDMGLEKNLKKFKVKTHHTGAHRDKFYMFTRHIQTISRSATKFGMITLNGQSGHF